jgi:hypothetical protein
MELTQYVVDTANSEFNLFEMGTSSSESGSSSGGDTGDK